MQKYTDRFNTQGTLLERFGEYAVLQIHSQDTDDFDEYLYVVMENRKLPAKWKPIQDSNNMVPIVQPYREGIVGHCFRQKVVGGVAVTPIIYYGSIEQPCEDMSVIVALDPCLLPEVFTGSDGTTDTVSYTLEYAEDEFFWNGGDGVEIGTNELDEVVGDTDSGAVWIFRDCDPCFGSDSYGVELEVYSFDNVCCSGIIGDR